MVLDISVPKVFGWSTTANNPIGAEYILMEEARGRQLVECWDELSAESRLAIMRDLVSIEAKLLSLKFSS